MNYKKIYNNLINRARNRILEGYSESHHIVPRCMGGLDYENNLVDLTPEEHFLAHQLLVKIYPKEKNLIFAVNMMCMNANNQRNNNKRYGWIKRLVAERFSKLKFGISYEEAYGLERSLEIKEKQRLKRIGTKRSKETKYRMSQSAKLVKKSEQHILNLSESQKKRDKSTRFCLANLTRGKPAKNRKKVLCLETGQIFDCAKDATNWIGKGVDEAARKGYKCGGYTWKYI